VTPDMVLSICQKFASANANFLIYASLLFALQLSPGFCALMNWLIYAVVMLSFAKINTLNYLLPRVRLIFTEMEMLLCWLRLGVLLARILC